MPKKNIEDDEEDCMSLDSNSEDEGYFEERRTINIGEFVYQAEDDEDQPDENEDKIASPSTGAEIEETSTHLKTTKTFTLKDTCIEIDENNAELMLQNLGQACYWDCHPFENKIPFVSPVYMTSDELKKKSKIKVGN